MSERERSFGVIGEESARAVESCGCGSGAAMRSLLIEKERKASSAEVHEADCGCAHSHDPAQADDSVVHAASGSEAGSSCCGAHSAESATHEHGHLDCTHDHSHEHDHAHGHGHPAARQPAGKKEDHAESKGCGCGCEVSMRDILNSAGSVGVVAAGSIAAGASSKRAHSHDHSHDHVHGEGVGCGHDHSDDRSELREMLVAIVLFFLGVFVGLSKLSIGALSYDLLKNALYLAAYLLSGYKTILGALKNLAKGELFDENFLMTLATFGAVGIGEYPEAAAVMILFQIGEYFQSKAVAKSRSSIAELMDIRPDFANQVQADGSVRVVNPDTLAVGDTILIRSGEKIPVDSTIIEGRTSIDNRALTGESVPIEATVGDTLMSGAININGLIKARVNKVFGESTVSKILELVQGAGDKKSNPERFITRFSKYYTPIVVLLAVLITVLPTLLLNEPFTKWFSRALIFLVISCPCALVISVPLSFFAGIGGASRRGILFKGSSYIEQLSAVKTVMLDKTGTLTKGIFEVSEIRLLDGAREQEVLELAAYAELHSNHPIAKSVLKEYERKLGAPIRSERIAEVEEISGYGVRAVIDGATVLAGNRRLMAQYHIEASDEEISATAVYVAKDGELLGVLLIEDKIKDDAQKAIGELNKMGIDTVMLTGDHKSIAEKVAQRLGVQTVYSELLPQNKVEKIEEVLARCSGTDAKTAFVGDGINDAPVLARADLGIAMGGIGSDAAIEAADVVLMTDEPSKIAEAIRISQKTMQVAKQNIVFALGIKILVMGLGTLGYANMWVAVFADVGVSLLAVLNAMRAYKTQA